MSDSNRVGSPAGAPGPPVRVEAAPSTLMRFMLLSVVAALVTMALKALAAVLTGSVGFLSDALESGVNLVAALVGLWALRLASRPPDLVHHFGHGKAEYLSAAVEGTMIFVAAVAIVWSAGERLLDPIPLDRPALGLVLSGGASVINLAVGMTLVRAGRRYRSITLEADGHHLLTDVVTSAGVLIGVVLVAVFSWEVLDPIVALLVGVNILHTGYVLLRRSVSGMLDAALPAADLAQVVAVLDRHHAERGVSYHALRTRESGRQRFVYLHLLVPDDWTVARGHDAAEVLKRDIAAALPATTTFVHVEPQSDPASYDDDELTAPP